MFSPRTKFMRAGVARTQVTFVLALAVAFVSSPAAGQGTWHQSEFVIGSWNDPFYTGDSLLTRNSYEQAKAAFFNLFTGTVNHFLQNPSDPPDAHYHWPYSPLNHYTSLTIAGELGLRVLLSDTHFTSACCATSAPSFDPTIPPNVFSMYDNSGADALSSVESNALWGYDLWDEPAWNAGNADFVKNWTSAMHADDAARNDGHPRAAYLNFFNNGSPNYTSALTQFVSDADATRQVDVVSTDLYPFFGNPPAYPTYYFRGMRDLRAVMGSRPFWIITTASEGEVGSNGNGVPCSAPDDNQFRFMAFCPAAAGAKGVVWFLYRGGEDDITQNGMGYVGADNGEEVVNQKRVPTCKYYQLKPINHFLHDVVGPVALNSTHLGIWHQSSNPTGEPELATIDTSVVCPATALGNLNFAVGVFRPTAQPADYYLLIVNKSLTAQSGTVVLRNASTVTQSPSVIGYVGGTSYTPVATSATSFAVSLAGGEGRMYHLTGTSTPDIALTSPPDGQTWLPGTQHVITWQGNGNPVDAIVYPSPLENGPEISGPSAVLGTGLTGGQATVTMPSVVTNHARLVISSAASDGIQRRVSHAQAFRSTPPPSQPTTYWGMGSGHCFLDADLAVGQDGAPRVLMIDHTGFANYSTFNGTSWQSTYIGSSSFKILPGVTVDFIGYPHVAFVDRGTPALDVAYQPNGTGAFTVSNLQILADPDFSQIGRPGLMAMTRGLDNYMYLAFNYGSGQGYKLKVFRSLYGDLSGWSPYTNAIDANDPRSIGVAANTNGPWMCYINGIGAQATLNVATYPSANPVTSLTLTGPYEHVAIAMDASGNPLLAYSKAVGTDGGSGLYYRSSSGGTWGAEVPVDVSAGTIESVSLAMWNGAARVAYVGSGVPKYAIQAGGTWFLDNLDASDDAAGPIKLAFAPNGTGWACWFDRTQDNLRVVSFTPDVTPPAAIALQATSACYDHVTLDWIAPGDDGSTGTATAYDLRWSANQITAANFGGATQITTLNPLPSGSQEELSVSVPRCSAARYYAIKARDEVYNWSALSNVVLVAPACPRPPVQCNGAGEAPIQPAASMPLPTVLELDKPTPNPIAGVAAQLRFGVPAKLAGSEYDLSVFDLIGRKLATVAHGTAVPGYHTVQWDLRSEHSERLAPGLYFLRLRLGAEILNRRLISVR